MAGRGKHRLPTATRLLALVAAGVVAAGIALVTGSAWAYDRVGSDEDESVTSVTSVTSAASAASAAVSNIAADPGDGSNDRGRGQSRGRDRDRDRDGDRGRDRDRDGNNRNDKNNNNRNDKKNRNDKDNVDENNKKDDKDKNDDKDKKDDKDTGGPNNGLEILGRDCTNSDLELHDGFQNAPRCVSTSAGEVSAADKNPSLLITSAPRNVRADEPFTITVSTRNLVRDRFLGAADGGYYLERSELNEDGLQRGHFHTSCRMLDSTDVAPDPTTEPDAFVATEDGGGGARPDTVKVKISGLPSKGIAQCSTWAGDGSHRIPMMAGAQQTPAFDAVRIVVK